MGEKSCCLCSVIHFSLVICAFDRTELSSLHMILAHEGFFSLFLGDVWKLRNGRENKL